MIKKGTKLLLFRYSDYKKYDFIDEHLKVIKEHGYVWLLKSGRKSNPSKIDDIINQGGWLILKQPKSSGGDYFLCRFTEVQEKRPVDGFYPGYYNEFVKERESNELKLNEQWFKITEINRMDDNNVNKIVLCKNEKKVVDIIGTTMTAVMFVMNDALIR